MKSLTPERTLTPGQVEQLFALCRSKGVHFYDIQVELVDHMAAAIEARPEVPFDKALSAVIEGFGFNGFAKTVETRRKQLQAQYRRMAWSMFIGYFNWPKVMLTLLIFTVLYVLQYYCPLYVLKAVTITAALYLLGHDGFLMFRQYRYRRSLGSPLLMLKTLPVLFVSAILLNFYLNLLKGFRWLDGDRPFTLFTYNAFIIAFIVMLAAVLAVGDTKKKIYLTARQRYPAAFMV
jgi:hypothetical protein